MGGGWIEVFDNGRLDPGLKQLLLQDGKVLFQIFAHQPHVNDNKHLIAIEQFDGPTSLWMVVSRQVYANFPQQIILLRKERQFPSHSPHHNPMQTCSQAVALEYDIDLVCAAKNASRYSGRSESTPYLAD